MEQESDGRTSRNGAHGTKPVVRTFRSGLSKKTGALGNPLFRRFWIGNFVTAGSIQVLQIGVGWLVVSDLGQGPGVLGLIGGAVAIPAIAVNVFGGLVADIFDRRHILMFTSIVNALLMTVLALLAVTEQIQVWHVIAIAALLGSVSGLDGPARNSFFPQLVERHQLSSAVSLNAVVWHMSRLLTPTLGGLAIRYLGTYSVFFAGVGGWITMLLLIISLKVDKPIKPASRDVIKDLKDGITYVARHRLFAVLIPLTALKAVFGLQYLSLMPVFATLHSVEADGLGVFYLVLSVGAITGAVLTSQFSRSEHLGKIMLASGVVFSLLVVAFAYAPSYPVALVAMYFIGIPHMIFIITSMTALQLRVDPALRGRVMGIYTLSLTMIPLGGLVGGGMAELIGARHALAISALLFGGVTLLVVVTQPAVLHLRGTVEETA